MSAMTNDLAGALARPPARGTLMLEPVIFSILAREWHGG
jgi:hypothetical protein